jgi:acetoin utilization deacetylase AcuC-like enzyme
MQVSAGATRIDPIDIVPTTRELGAELGAPILVCLEGGYALGALASSTVATLEALCGEEQPRLAPERPAAQYRRAHGRFWPVLNGQG